MAGRYQESPSTVRRVISIDQLPLREDLKGKKPYGAPEWRTAITLNVNENAHPIPEYVQEDIVSRIAGAIRDINRYPDREFFELRAQLALYLANGLEIDNMWAANGSNEVLQQIFQAFGGPGRTVLGFTPTYSMYPILATATGTGWIEGQRDSDYELSVSTAVEWVTRTNPDIIVLCSPNNPTGTPLSLEVICEIYEASRGIVVVDEAYAEFSPPRTPSAAGLLPGRGRLIVCRTMSKAFAFAGARVGYLAADPAVVDALRLVRLPYHLSAITQAAALGALAHTDAMLSMVGDVIVQRDRMTQGLRSLGYHPYPSWANFVLFGGVSDPSELFQALCQRDILVRNVGIPGTLRVTAGTENETSAFLAALGEIGPR